MITLDQLWFPVSQGVGVYYRIDTSNLNLRVLRTQSHKTFIEEACYAAQHLHRVTQKLGLEIWLCLSGGIDSESMALSFIKAQVPFRVAIMRFQDGLNAHDIKFAVEFCSHHNLRPLFFDLDLFNFYFSRQHLKYAAEVNCASPQIASHLWLAEQVPGFFVFAGERLLVTRDAHRSWVYNCPNKDHYSIETLMRVRKNLIGVGNFFQLTAPLIQSSIKTDYHPRNSDLYGVLGKDQFQSSLRYHSAERFYFEQYRNWAYKYCCYVHEGFFMQSRPNKYTGFELVHDYFSDKNSELHPLQKRFTGLLNFNKIFRNEMIKFAPQANGLNLQFNFVSSFDPLEENK